MKSNLKFFKKKKFFQLINFFKMFFMIKKLVIMQLNNLLEKGDFITAPKISNLFSEIIAIWIISTWEFLENQKILI